MSEMKRYRPALAAMGFWKWPSLLLVLFATGMIVPYWDRATGSHAVSGQIAEGSLAACPIQVGVLIAGESLEITAVMQAVCAANLKPPRVALLGPQGDVLVQSGLGRNPNQLRATLSFPADIDPDVLSLSFRSASPSGVVSDVSWPLAHFIPDQRE